MPKNMIVADDSMVIQKSIGITFAQEDITITFVGNGDEALTKAKQIKPDIILADVSMPQKNGYEVCENLKNDPQLQGIPVLLLAGAHEPFDQARADTVGAAGHVIKPFESQVLIDRVHKIFSEQKAAPTPPPQAPTPQPQAPLASGAPPSPAATIAGQAPPFESELPAQSEAQASPQAAAEPQVSLESEIDLSFDGAFSQETPSPPQTAPAPTPSTPEPPLGADSPDGTLPAGDFWDFSADTDAPASTSSITATQPRAEEGVPKEQEAEPFSLESQSFAESEQPVDFGEEDTGKITITEALPVEATVDLEETTSTPALETGFDIPIGETTEVAPPELLEDLKPEPTPQAEVTDFEPLPVEEASGFDLTKDSLSEIRVESPSQEPSPPPEAPSIPKPAVSEPQLPESKDQLPLSDSQVEEIVSKVFQKVIERIAWEVVPDLAETIIKEELARLTKEQS